MGSPAKGPPIQGTAWKKGRFKGSWKERYFYMGEGSATLSYWESDADFLGGSRARGEMVVYGASILEDCSEQAWGVAVHVSPDGRVERVLRAAGGAGTKEEWLALRSAGERDAWVAALNGAAVVGGGSRQVSEEGESFALDDDVWEEAGRVESASPPLGAAVATATVYDYSIVREGWRVRVTYHVLVTADGPGSGEPWSIRRTHADFRASLAGQETGDSTSLQHGCPRSDSHGKKASAPWVRPER